MSFQKSWTTSKLSSNARLEVTSENTNAQACCAYDIFLQQFKSLTAFSHPYSCSYHLFLQGIALPDPSSHPFQTCSKCRASVRFRKWRQILLENSYVFFFQRSCSLTHLSHSSANVLADKSELRFRNIWQSSARITAYFFQRFTFLSSAHTL